MMHGIDFFHEATLRICGSLEIEVVAQDCLEYLRDYIPLDGISIHYYDEKNSSIIVLATTSTIPLDLSRTTVPICRKGDQMFRDTKDAVHIYNNPEDGPVPLAVWKALGCVNKSSLVLFVAFKGKRMGQIDFFCRGRNRYTSEHARIIEQLYHPFAIAMANSLQYREIVNIKRLLVEDNRYLRQALQRRGSSTEIVGAGAGLSSVMKAVEQVAPLTSHVLLLGETGVGKEVVSNAIHYSSPRRDGPFIKINCGAIPDGLIDTELFGHEKGAFTGAVSREHGCFERAHQGTIFLDEVGDLPARAQASLLRVLQEKEIKRVGGKQPIRVDVRVIAATNKNLETLVHEGRFREDLWFRLNVFPITIPPLRERKSDIPDLVRYFISVKSREMNLGASPVLPPGTMERLLAYDWPGNVRELGNIIERGLIRMCGSSPNESLVLDGFLPERPTPDMPESVQPASLQAGTRCTLDEAMRQHILSALESAGGRIQGPRGAAVLLGVKPNTLRYRMRKLGIPFGRDHQP